MDLGAPFMGGIKNLMSREFGLEYFGALRKPRREKHVSSMELTSEFIKLEPTLRAARRLKPWAKPREAEIAKTHADGGSQSATRGDALGSQSGL